MAAFIPGTGLRPARARKVERQPDRCAGRAARPGVSRDTAGRADLHAEPLSERIASDQIELHVRLIEEIDSADALEALLSCDEKQRAGRFAFERHRQQYIAAHGLLRLALSNVAPEVAPAEWSFVIGRYGRPLVAAPATSTALHFSLSHADGCVACVVSGDEAVGVDVERVSPRNALMETAQNVFSPDELQALRGLSTGDFINRFFDYWTLKEAYLKAKGFGLHRPLDRFSMRICPGSIGIRFEPDIADDPRQWRFTLSSPSPAHRLAIADGSGMAGGLPIVRHRLRHRWLAASS